MGKRALHSDDWVCGRGIDADLKRDETLFGDETVFRCKKVESRG
jgi:hypothetical protein